MTPRTDAWKARLSAAVAGRGIKAELARYLCEGEHQLASRKVQIAKVLNQGAMPEPEFVLATLEWMDVEQRTLLKDAKVPLGQIESERSRNRKARR